MINQSTPILQIRVRGLNVPDTKTIQIKILSENKEILKGNRDIEIDNDILMVSLTQEEAESLKNGNANIYVTALDSVNEKITKKIKVLWAKMGSRYGLSYGGISEDVFNKTIFDIKFDIEDLENGLTIGNDRVYLDYQNGKYGINTNPNRGADTFIPFKEEGDDGIKSPMTIPFRFSGQYSFFNKGYNLDIRSYFPNQIQNKIKKIIIKEMTIKRNNLISGKPSSIYHFIIYGVKSGETVESNVYSYSFSTPANQIYVYTTKINDVEIKTDMHEKVICFGIYATTKSSYVDTQYEIYGTMEIYF